MSKTKVCGPKCDMRDVILLVLWLSYSPLDPRLAGSNLAGVDGFSERKNPEYEFLWKGSKAMGAVS